MARIRITAAGTGFNIIEATGNLLPVDTFFSGDLSGSGSIINTGQGWVWGNSLVQHSYGMQIVAETPTSMSPQLGSTTTVLVSEIIYWQTQDGLQVEIGRMTLPQPIEIAAIWQTIGNTGQAGWLADIGTALADTMSQSAIQFMGGAGNDVFSAESDALYMRGRSVISGFDGDDQLTGSVGNDTIRGGAGNDILIDNSGQNMLAGGAGDDVLSLGARSDHSVARGGSGNDSLYSSLGADSLYGNAGADQLYGGAGQDRLYGGGGADFLDGGTGDDIIDGGRGSDILIGDGGADTFIFRVAERGRDTILDFQDGIDIISLAGLADGFAALSFTQNGANTLISWDGQTYLTLYNFEATDLRAADFVFI